MAANADGPPDISIVVPVFRNAPTLMELHRRLSDVLAAVGRPYELIFVDDASPDDSRAILDDLATRSPLVVVPMGSNVGQHRAILHGLRHTRGSTIVVLDADLQDPPEAIPRLLDRLREGFGVAYAARRGRYQPLARRITSRIFKWSMRLMAGVPVDMGPFAAWDRRVVDSVLARAADRPFVPALVVGAGLPIAAVPVARSRRPIGRSAYSHWDRLRMAWSVLGSLARRPRG